MLGHAVHKQSSAGRKGLLAIRAGVHVETARVHNCESVQGPILQHPNACLGGLHGSRMNNVRWLKSVQPGVQLSSVLHESVQDHGSGRWQAVVAKKVQVATASPVWVISIYVTNHRGDGRKEFGTACMCGSYVSNAIHDDAKNT